MSCSTFNTDEKTTSSELISDFDCSICYELLHEPVVGTSLQPSADSEHQTCLGTCGHDFCKYCYDQWIYGKRSPPCPICKKPLPKDLGEIGISHVPIRSIFFQGFVFAFEIRSISSFQTKPLNAAVKSLS